MFADKQLNDYWQALPELPGVYLFKGGAGQILYVGKANNLRQRVASYARPRPNDWKTQAMIAEAESIDFRLLNSPLEALLFEAQLIQAHQPPFNLMLKTGAPFYYFLFTAGKLPKMLLVRNKTQPGTYVGPFLQRGQARKIYEFLMRTFALRLCQRKIEGGCMYFHIGACAGACRKEFDLAGYKQRLLEVKKLLEAGFDSLRLVLEGRIEVANKALNFELARSLNRQLEELAAAEPMFSQAGISSARSALGSLPEDVQHIWLLWPDGSGLQLFEAQKGLVKVLELWVFPEQHLLPSQTCQYLESYYLERVCPNSIFVNFELDEKTAMESFLSQWHKKLRPVAIIDRIGQFPPDSVILAQTMAAQTCQNLKQIPKKLAALVGSTRPIVSIDCFDISHRQGKFMVGSCVRFVGGRPDKDGFRRFLIKTVEGQNDYACLAEVVGRRYQAGVEDFPDLVLIDGGKGQRSAVAHLVGQTPLAALAKQEERLFCAQNYTAGVKLNPHSPHGALLIALRDYTHHFAISYHRRLSSKVELL